MSLLLLFRSIYFLLLWSRVQARDGFDGESKQDWGYITVRPNAHMFWWLYYTTYNNGFNYTDRPLIIWLQGGPGMSSTGYGNFMEIGLLNASFHKRQESLVENFNVLFIDNPVGAGYSYFSDSANNATTFVRNGNEIGKDLYTFLKRFLKKPKYNEFEKVPLYIFGESYGAKMATEFVYKLKKKELNGNSVFCNLKGLGLGDAYISPIDYIKNYAPIALYLGLVNKHTIKPYDKLVKELRTLIDTKQYKSAFFKQTSFLYKLYAETNQINIYNFQEIFSETELINRHKKDKKAILESIMNNEIKSKLNIPEDVTWRFYSPDLYKSLIPDLLKSETYKIEFLLKRTDIKILVYNGILDIIVNTAGTLSWLDSLNWQGQEEWFNQNQTALIIDEIPEGYSKRVDNLVFYAILRAGHTVSIDNLSVINKILRCELLNSPPTHRFLFNRPQTKQINCFNNAE